MAVTLMGSFEKDNYLEIYNTNRTPTYAMKFLQDAIEYKPIMESQLFRHNMMSPSRKGETSGKILFSINSVRSQGGPVCGSSWERNVNEVLDSGRSSGGEHTKTTLLRERLNSSRSVTRERECLKNSTPTSRPNSVKQAIKNRYQYGFLVGARYTKDNFVSKSTSQYNGKKSLSNSQFGPDTNDDDADRNLPTSPPNSPLSPTELASPLPDQPIKDSCHDSPIHKPNISCSITKPEYDIRKPISLQRRPLTAASFSFRKKQNLNQNSSSNSPLPKVNGYSFLEIRSITPHSGIHSQSNETNIIPPRVNWSRAEINLHFSRLNRNMKNRRSVKSATSEVNFSV